MSGNLSSTEKELSPTVVTEAAAWIARLHGPYRTPAVERGFHSWLNEGPDHAKAVELVTESWDEVAALKTAANIDITLPSDKPESGSKMRLAPAALAAAVSIVAIAGAIYYVHSSGVATGVGEQRLLTLEDGSRVYLNTSTRVIVQYKRKIRRVILKSGEALFEVAKPIAMAIRSHGRRS